MNKKIVAVCESERSLNSLKTAANDLGFDLVYEIHVPLSCLSSLLISF